MEVLGWGCEQEFFSGGAALDGATSRCVCWDGETAACLPSPCSCKQRKQENQGCEPIVPAGLRSTGPMSKTTDEGAVLRGGLNAASFPQSVRTIGAEERFYGVPGQNI